MAWSVASGAAIWCGSLPLYAWHPGPSRGTAAVGGPFILIHVLWLSIDETFDGIIVRTVLDILIVVIVVRTETAGAASAPSTATQALVVSGQRIAPSKLATAFGTDMGPLTGMKLGMTLQVV